MISNSVQHYEKTTCPGQVAQLIEASSHRYTRKVADSIPSQGTYLGHGPNPQSGSVQEATKLLFLSLLPFPSKINEYISVRTQKHKKQRGRECLGQGYGWCQGTLG